MSIEKGRGCEKRKTNKVAVMMKNLGEFRTQYH